MNRRRFLKYGTSVLPIAAALPANALSLIANQTQQHNIAIPSSPFDEKADYTLRIQTGLLETGPQQIISTTLYNDQFPGPLLRFKEGQQAVVDVHNDTDTPELVHWHGQSVPSDVDGASEEGTPFVPAHGMRRMVFVPRPAGFRFYH